MARSASSAQESAGEKPLTLTDSPELFKSAIRTRFDQAEAAVHAAARDRNPVEASRQTEIANACAALLRALP